MKNALLLSYLLSSFVSCQVNRNTQKISIDSLKPILLKKNLNGIGDEFSEDIIHSVNGNVKSVEFSNYSFSKKDSVFLPTYSSLIDNYRNCIYSINKNGEIENRIVLKGKERIKIRIDKYEFIDISKNEYKIEFKQYEYNEDKIGEPNIAPKYTNYYNNQILIKKIEDLGKNTILYNYNNYNDLVKISQIKVINTENIYRNKIVKFKYDSNKRIIEKHHEYENSSSFHQTTKYIYQDDSYTKVNFNYKNNKKTNIDFEFTKLDKFNNIIERKQYNPLKFNKEILEIESDKELLDSLISEIENSNKNWIIYSGKYEYEFDDNNNWTTKTIFQNDKPIYKLKRIIEYY